MKILVLEDMKVRVDWLKKEFPDAQIIWKMNATDFLSELPKHQDVDLILLDHDLGGSWGDIQQGTDGLTGLDVADQMVNIQCPIFIWSWNPYGAMSMWQSLQSKGLKASQKPFGTQDLKASIFQLYLGQK